MKTKLRITQLLILIIAAFITISCGTQKSREENKFVGMWYIIGEDNIVCNAWMEFTKDNQIINGINWEILSTNDWVIEPKGKMITIFDDEGNAAIKWRYKFEKDNLTFYSITGERALRMTKNKK